MADKEKEAEELASRQAATSGADYVVNIIAGINPGKYFDYETASQLNEFKQKLKKNFWDAVASTKPKSPWEHKLVYNSSSETLEPVYFWVLDKMNDFFPGGVDKLVDNFSSTPGSGHFGEMGARAAKMQEEGMKIMQTTGVLIKSIVNIVYDLKEFELRLSQYKDANSKDKARAEAGFIALKQIWMDNVDIKKGRGSINMMAQDLQFVTLRDAFMIAKSLEDVNKLDLNDRVKRILEARINEFLKWRELSEAELKKRYEIEKSYLKNQIASLKMYSRWAKPYLKAAAQLEMKNLKSPSLVTAFSTTIFQLTLLGKSKIKVAEEAIDKNLPDSFRNLKLKRDYYACVLIDFNFRGIPERLGQNYAFGGRVEVKFRAFAMNSKELEMLEQKLEQSDINDALALGSAMTTESLEVIKDDLEYFLKPEEERESIKVGEEKKSSQDVNPFLALFGLGGKKEAKKLEKGKEKITEIKPDNYAEKMIRDLAQRRANETCFNLFDIYKKSHGMPSHPAPEEF